MSAMACRELGEQACGTKACGCFTDITVSPEAKHFLVWLHANGFTDNWQAYDPGVRDNYRRSMGASMDHMAEIQRVMEDPYFGRPQPCNRCGSYLYTHYLVSFDGVVVCAACAAT